jgi:hypothetical protein
MASWLNSQYYSSIIVLYSTNILLIPIPCVNNANFYQYAKYEQSKFLCDWPQRLLLKLKFHYLELRSPEIQSLKSRALSHQKLWLQVIYQVQMRKGSSNACFCQIVHILHAHNVSIKTEFCISLCVISFNR